MRVLGAIAGIALLSIGGSQLTPSSPPLGTGICEVKSMGLRPGQSLVLAGEIVEVRGSALGYRALLSNQSCTIPIELTTRPTLGRARVLVRPEGNHLLGEVTSLEHAVPGGELIQLNATQIKHARIRGQLRVGSKNYSITLTQTPRIPGTYRVYVNGEYSVLSMEAQ